MWLFSKNCSLAQLFTISVYSPLEGGLATTAFLQQVACGSALQTAVIALLIANECDKSQASMYRYENLLQSKLTHCKSTSSAQRNTQNVQLHDSFDCGLCSRCLYVYSIVGVFALFCVFNHAENFSKKALLLQICCLWLFSKSCSFAQHFTIFVCTWTF